MQPRLCRVSVCVKGNFGVLRKYLNVLILPLDCSRPSEKHTMMLLEDIQEALKDRKIKMVAEATGLHYNTVRQLASSPDANPTYKVVKALSDYLERK